MTENQLRMVEGWKGGGWGSRRQTSLLPELDKVKAANLLPVRTSSRLIGACCLSLALFSLPLPEVLCLCCKKDVHRVKWPFLP